MLKSRRVPAVLAVLVLAALFEGWPRAQTRTAAPPAPSPPASAQAAAAQPAALAGKLTTPTAEWGHTIGDDYFLVNFQQLTAYWKKLDWNAVDDTNRNGTPASRASAFAM